MKRKKLLRIIEETRQRDRLHEAPVTFDNLTVCWSARTVTFRGRTITATEADRITFPLLGTDRLVITKSGDVAGDVA